MLAKHAEVPIAKDAASRFLPWLVAFMVYLAALALTCTMAMQQMVDRWDRGLAGRITVQVPPPSDDAADGQSRVEHVLGLLRETEGLRNVEALDQEQMADLLEPWLGDSVLDQNLPLPALIAVTLDESKAPPLDELRRSLEALVPGVVVDDHQRWLGHLLVLARTIKTIAAFVLLAVGLSAVATIVFVTRTGLAIHHAVIELLHLVGAQDSYVARQFETHALFLGLRGGLIGLVFAFATMALLNHLLERSQSGLLPDLSLSVWEILVVALLPLATGLIAMVTARLTVLHSLSRVP